MPTTTFSPEQLSLGEGPLTHHLRGSLVWCDINNRALFERKFEPKFERKSDADHTRRFELDVMPSAAGIIDAHRILVATEVDFRILNLDTGATSTHLNFPDDPDTRSNDGRVHPSGAFWIGTMQKDGRRAPGAIWRLFDGKLERMIDDVSVPNSICFAADGTFAYFADSAKRTIWRVATDASTGALAGEPTTFVELSDGEAGVPDGSVLDADGNLWNARWGGGVIDVYDPDGARIASHAVPAHQPTCPAFVGAALDRVVTTSATAGLGENAVGADDGTVLLLDVAIRGRPEPTVRL